jgi:2-iminobutanoate/2-iminopropanoate deaminase
MSKERIFPEAIAKPSGVWSPVVVAKRGDLVFLSGFTSRNQQGEVVGIGDIKAQTRRVCELLQIAVRSAGGELSDIVRVDVYVRDINQFRAIHEVRREFFPVDPPASTMVEVSRMVDERSLIEINAIAVVEGRTA